jgi:hypothetical protein
MAMDDDMISNTADIVTEVKAPLALFLKMWLTNICEERKARISHNNLIVLRRRPALK